MDPNALARKHLDARLAPLRSLSVAAPPRGWVRAIRDALGMTSRQFARRLGLAQSTIMALEKGEAQGSVSLATLRHAAEALDCTLVYALVPNKPLDEILRRRAREVADATLARTHHTMQLEDQGLEEGDLKAERERLVGEMMRESPRRLWDER
jgi:predicted DNA-binding mobile mystery protein A